MARHVEHDRAEVLLRRSAPSGVGSARRLGFAPNILARRVKGFVGDGLMERRGGREYVVTERAASWAQ